MSFSTESRLTLPVGERDHIVGPADASLVLVEYGDYECAHCMRAHGVVRAIRQHLEDDLAFVFRHFPLSASHPMAQTAAESAEAAGAQDLFWEMHDAIFTRTSSLSTEVLLSLADSIGADSRMIARELESGVHAARVREDFMSGVRSGVNGTPTFFVNGLRYDGFPEFDAMMDAIDSLES